MKRLPGGGIKVFDMGEWEDFSKSERLPGFLNKNGLLWLEKVYAALLKKHDPKDIVSMGDSAGANLILSLTCRLKEKPGKLIVISPAWQTGTL